MARTLAADDDHREANKTRHPGLRRGDLAAPVPDRLTIDDGLELGGHEDARAVREKSDRSSTPIRPIWPVHATAPWFAAVIGSAAKGARK